MLRGKFRQKLANFFLNHSEFESAVVGFIEMVEPKQLTGDEKKKIVLKKIEVWLDEKIALRGFWEMLSDIAIRWGLILLSGWVESIFQRWKAEKKIASIEKPSVIAESAPVVATKDGVVVKEKRAKKQE